MATPRHVGREIKALNNQIKRVINSRLERQRPQGEYRPTGSQGLILGFLYLHRDKEIYQRDVEAEFHIRRSTATGILQLLEREGLIRRLPVAKDARLKKLELTPKALAIHAQVDQEIQELEAQMLRGLSQTEIEAFFSALCKIRENIE